MQHQHIRKLRTSSRSHEVHESQEEPKNDRRDPSCPSCLREEGSLPRDVRLNPRSTRHAPCEIKNSTTDTTRKRDRIHGAHGVCIPQSLITKSRSSRKSRGTKNDRRDPSCPSCLREEESLPRDVRLNPRSTRHAPCEIKNSTTDTTRKRHQIHGAHGCNTNTFVNSELHHEVTKFTKITRNPRVIVVNPRVLRAFVKEGCSPAEAGLPECPACGWPGIVQLHGLDLIGPRSPEIALRWPL